METVTLDELKQYSELKKEIVMWEERLEELRAEIDRTTSKLTGLPIMHNSDKSELMANYADKVDAYVKKKIECEKLHSKIVKYITGIPDSYIRQIMMYRYIDCFTWNKIGILMETNDSVVRQACHRYLRKM